MLTGILFMSLPPSALPRMALSPVLKTSSPALNVLEPLSPNSFGHILDHPSFISQAQGYNVCTSSHHIRNLTMHRAQDSAQVETLVLSLALLGSETKAWQRQRLM